MNILIILVIFLDGIDGKNDRFRTRVKQTVRGVTWFENTIYVIFKASNVVQVFPEKETFDKNGESEHINIKLRNMKDPYDMVASEHSQLIFISDQVSTCLWRIQMPDRKVDSWEIKGTPWNMSISSCDWMVVCVAHEARDYLCLYKKLDVNKESTIILPTKVRYLIHAVMLPNKNFVISYSMKNTHLSFLISELSADGRNFIHTFDPRSLESNILVGWTPNHLTTDEDGNIFIADSDNARVVMLNSRFKELRFLSNKKNKTMNTNKHSMEIPWRLCYVGETKQLIVGQLKSFQYVSCYQSLSIFNFPEPQSK